MNMLASPDADAASVHFLNRDHIIVASMTPDAVIITMISGERILISGSPTELNDLIDRLVNAVGSNFLPVALQVETRLPAQS
jgi:uncharacterized protein YlzI (FlbEa/FlbD family)